MRRSYYNKNSKLTRFITRNIAKFMAFMAIIFGAFMASIGIFAYKVANGTKKHINVEAVISRIETPINSDDDHHVTYVKYQVNGIEYENKLGYYSSNFSVGDHLTIYYFEGNPNKIGYAKGNNIILIVFCSLGGAFFLGGVITLAVSINHKRKHNQLMISGKRITTSFVEVILNTNLSVNNTNPYKIITEYTDQLTKEKYTFKSINFWDDPTSAIQFLNKKTFTVYVNEKNYRRYVMDTSEVEKLLNDGTLLTVPQEQLSETKISQTQINDEYSISDDDYRL